VNGPDWPAVAWPALLRPGFALFTHSSERTRTTFLSAGLPFGTPEDALDRDCGLYLGDPPA
jgi:hypothetical protein